MWTENLRRVPGTAGCSMPLEILAQDLFGAWLQKKSRLVLCINHSYNLNKCKCELKLVVCYYSIMLSWDLCGLLHHFRAENCSSNALEKGLLCVCSMQELKVCLDYALLVFLVIKTFMVQVILSIRYLKQKHLNVIAALFNKEIRRGREKNWRQILRKLIKGWKVVCKNQVLVEMTRCFLFPHSTPTTSPPRPPQLFLKKKKIYLQWGLRWEGL